MIITSNSGRLGALFGGLVLLVSLAACSGGAGTPSDQPDETTPVATSEGSSADGNESSDSQGSPSSSDSDASASDSNNEALLAAAKTALDAVPDSTVISIETEHNDTQWEVEVVTADGTEYEVEVSGDGKQVVSGPHEESDDAKDKAKHRDRVAAAKLSYADAVTAITDAVPGRITELNIDTEDGVTVWEADVIDADNVKHEVSIDAATGKVLTKH